VGNPFANLTCAEYNPRRELTVMLELKFSLPLPSPGSFIGIGTASRIVGRPDINLPGMWSWTLYPRYHPNGVNVVVDLLLRNATHEIRCKAGVNRVSSLVAVDLLLRNATHEIRCKAGVNRVSSLVAVDLLLRNATHEIRWL
jgi:hypothetical protein